MLYIFLALLTVGSNMAEDPDFSENDFLEDDQVVEAQPLEDEDSDGQTGSSSVSVGSGVSIGSGVVINDAAISSIPAVPGMDMSVVPAGVLAEDQSPTGKYLTATEIRPIMEATKSQWVAVREFDGQDLVYVSSIWSWRCGLAAMAYSINDEPLQNLQMPPCRADTGAPNAVKPEDGVPFLTFELGSVDSVSVQLVYDDLTMDAATYQRNDVLIP